MTYMRLRLTCTVSLSVCIGGEGGMGGMLMMLMLFCMMLIAYAEDNNGDDDTCGNNNDNDNVAPCCPGCYVTFKTPPIQEHSCFLGFRDKNFATDPNNQQK